MLLFRKYFPEAIDGVWGKTLNISIVLFFIFLGDAILSFWVPNLIQDAFKSPQIMGLIISFSSLVGLLADLVLPQILKRISVNKLLVSAIFCAIAFPVLLFFGTKSPTVFIFLTAMAVWGIYYEFLGFSSKQFVADSIALPSRSTSWAIMDVFRSLAYFLGPLIAGWIILKNEILPVPVSIAFVLIALFLLIVLKRDREVPSQIELKEINIFKELSHWAVLFKHVWPMIVVTLFLGIIDATFWTVGAVWTEDLIKESFWGGFFLPAYMLPSLFMGLVVAKWGVFEGKKKIAEKYMLLAGIFLASLGIFNYIFWQILMVFISSIMLAVTYPMVDAVYSDIVARMGRERRHLIGLSSSSVSLAYIIGPSIAGFVAEMVGEKMTFVVVGIAVVVVSGILLLITPKKLELPQTEIKSWG